MIKCDMCGKGFPVGNTPCGIPNGVSFDLSDGSRITACAECVMRVGENPKYLDEFLERRKKGENGSN